MPELPEVEVSRRQLARWAEGRTLDAVRVVDAAVVRNSLSSKPSDKMAEGVARMEALVGCVAKEPVRHGKRLGWSFGGEGFVSHFGMTGAWTPRPNDAEMPASSRLGLVFGDRTLWFVDGRRFACVVPVASDSIDDWLRNGAGPDALLEPLDGAALAERVSCRKAIKVALMDQERIAGIGNIHASEACHRAGLSPNTRADALPADTWNRLATSIREALVFAIEHEGDTDEIVYVNLGGPNPFAVYGRSGEPCKTCGQTILSEELGGRGTYWCPQCQP